MSSNADVLHEIGQDWILKVIRIVPEILCYGLYLILMSVLFTILARHGFIMRGPNIFLLVVTVLMFAGATIFLCLDIADLIRRMQIVLLEHPEETNLQAKLDRTNEATTPLFRTEEILFIFMLSLGDSVVVWRTWAICVGRRKWVGIPIATLLGSAFSAVFELGCNVETKWAAWDISLSTSPVGAEICKHSDMASFILSYITNVICTLLVAYQTWQYRKALSNYLGAARRKTQAEKLLVLVIESGFVYILLNTTQAVPILGAKLSSKGLVFSNVFNAIIQQTMGIYPTLIIVLVKLQKSLWDTNEVTSSIHCSRLQFATVVERRSHDADRMVQSLNLNDADSTTLRTGQVNGALEANRNVLHQLKLPIIYS